MSTRKNNQEKSLNFEKSIEKLNSIVTKMEQGDLPLETSLKYFEEGVNLIRHCQQTLKEAEQKVEILSQEQGQATLKPYNENESN